MVKFHIRKEKDIEDIVKRIEINPKILVGKPIIVGIRIPAELIVKYEKNL